METNKYFSFLSTTFTFLASFLEKLFNTLRVIVQIHVYFIILRILRKSPILLCYANYTIIIIDHTYIYIYIVPVDYGYL